MRRVGGAAFGLLVLGAVALPAAAVPAERLPASAGGATANSMTFTDPAGDVRIPRADITTVTVSNDDAGNLRFEVPSAPPAHEADAFHVFVDTDGNPHNRLEEFLAIVRLSRNEIYFENSSGPVAGADVSARYSENAHIVEFNRSLLQSGSSVPLTKFDFAVGLFAVASGGVFYDWAPDHGPDARLWSYEIVMAPPAAPKRVAIGSLTRRPQVPVAGKPFEVAVGVKRVGRPGPFRGDVTCGASIAGNKLRGTGSVSAGRASCRWRIPANAARKTISGSIAVSEDGPAVTRRFSGKIRSR